MQPDVSHIVNLLRFFERLLHRQKYHLSPLLTLFNENVDKQLSLCPFQKFIFFVENVKRLQYTGITDLCALNMYTVRTVK